MVSVNDAASYVFKTYKEQTGRSIDEMKLHKLLYFAQRESLIRTGQPLFDATFYGWKYGPILKEVREMFHYTGFENQISDAAVAELKPVMDVVFSNYAQKDSWSLSRLTHGERSWQKSREGVLESDNSDNPMSLEDIRNDAQRIKERRALLGEIGLL